MERTLFELQDDVLVGLTTLPPKIHRHQLYLLPPWRAAMLARLAHSAGVMTRQERDNIVNEARLVGGDGRLKPWGRRTPSEQEKGVHSPWKEKE